MNANFAPSNRICMYDIAIVGGGIVGAATAYKIQQRFPKLKLVLLEKEERLADHQTGHNSGVIHSGLYYAPGSLKAKNCMKGRVELVEFAKEHNIAHDVCGKVVVATHENELPHMDKILQNGIANGLTGVEKITSEQIREIEPECHGIAGLWVPQTGIIDFRAATEKMAELVTTTNSESEIRMGEEVLYIEKRSDHSVLHTNKDRYQAKYTIFCAGLQADRMAKKDKVMISEKVVGFRGDYYELTEEAEYLVNDLIYPLPNPEFPFLGVHFTRMALGGIECGPNAVFAFKREGYKKLDFNLNDTIDALSYSGTWRLFLGNISFGINEYRRAFSKKLFLTTLQRLIPSLEMDDLKPGRSGVRAMLLKADGDTKDDFRIEYGHRSIHVLNAPSPAATASLAIGGQICEMAEKQFGLADA